jgi:hypothetical protein
MIELQNGIHLHLHLPDRGIGSCGEQAPHEHVHLYVHAAAGGEWVPTPAPPTPRSWPLLKGAAAATIVLVCAVFGARLAGHRADVAPTPTAAQASAASGDGAPRAAAAPQTQLPPAIAQQLASPPQLSPPAAESGGAPAPSGPTLFGLRN